MSNASVSWKSSLLRWSVSLDLKANQVPPVRRVSPVLKEPRVMKDLRALQAHKVRQDHRDREANQGHRGLKVNRGCGVNAVNVGRKGCRASVVKWDRPDRRGHAYPGANV